MKKRDYFVILIISILLGVFIFSQSVAGKKYIELIQPENSAVLALEVARQTQVNAELRSEIRNLTQDLEKYKDTSLSSENIYLQYKKDLDLYQTINGRALRGQGVILKIDGKLSTAQVVDLVNAIRNIGSSYVAINDVRVMASTDLSRFSNADSSDIKILGNTALIKSALERKGGILELISDKDIKHSIETSDGIDLPAGNIVDYYYSKIAT